MPTMATGIQLLCSEPRVRAGLQSWLDAGRLAPPVELSLAVTIGEPPSTVDERLAVFRQPTVAIRSGGPGGEVHISWELAPAVAILQPDATRAQVTLSPAAAAQLERCTRTFLMTVLILLLRRAGWHHVHGATAVDPSGRGWLIAGASGAGKSTTAALLARRGWGVGTDDVAFLALAGERVAVMAFRTPVALRSDGVHVVQQAGGVPLGERGKVGYWPEDLGGTWVPRVVPEVILFTAVGNGTTFATPLGARDTLAALVRWSAWVVLEPALAQDHLDLLARLAAQARSYRVTLGRDLFAEPTRLAELVS